MSVRSILTILAFIVAIIFYIVFLITKEKGYAYCSLMSIFFISIMTICVSIGGIEWLMMY